MKGGSYPSAHYAKKGDSSLKEEGSHYGETSSLSEKGKDKMGVSFLPLKSDTTFKLIYMQD